MYTEKQIPIFKDNQWTQVQYDYDGNKTLGRRVINLTEQEVIDDYPELFDKPLTITLDLVAALRDYTLALPDGVNILMTNKDKVSAWIKNDFFLESTFVRNNIEVGAGEMDLLLAFISQGASTEGNPLYGETDLVNLLVGFVTDLKTKVKV